jgi:NO-binding membrane sensor protein with MHYT domain
MLEGHNPYLVALSVLVAIFGGYTGFGLAARIRASARANHRLLLAAAAVFLALGIWTMHFIGMLAAPMPQDAVYLVLPTIVSFLICALVVGVSLFFVSVGEPSHARLVASALLLGAGVVLMHYVGINALVGQFEIEHEPAMVVLAALIAVGTAYGGLRIFLARQGGLRLALSAIAFGIAVSGMHYTAMHGMHLVPGPNSVPAAGKLVASAQVVALAVALLCFLITSGFLLFLVPEPRRRLERVPTAGGNESTVSKVAANDFEASRLARLPMAAFIAGPEKTRPAPASRLPVTGANGTHFIDVADIRGIRADSHYTLVHDGARERMCPWSISHVEAQLDPVVFARVHRSHIVSIPHVTFIRRERDGAVVELGGPVPHMVPVSRAKIAELKARLGLAKRGVAAH